MVGYQMRRAIEGVVRAWLANVVQTVKGLNVGTATGAGTGQIKASADLVLGQNQKISIPNSINNVADVLTFNSDNYLRIAVNNTNGVIIPVGLNVGTGAGAGTGEIFTSGKARIGPQSYIESTAETTVNNTTPTTVYTIPAASAAGTILVNGTDTSAGGDSVTYQAVVYWSKSADTLVTTIEEKVGAAWGAITVSGDNIQFQATNQYLNYVTCMCLWSQH